MSWWRPGSILSTNTRGKGGVTGEGWSVPMSKRTVLRVDTSCAKCKRKVLLAVSSLQGTYVWIA